MTIITLEKVESVQGFWRSSEHVIHYALDTFHAQCAINNIIAFWFSAGSVHKPELCVRSRIYMRFSKVTLAVLYLGRYYIYFLLTIFNSFFISLVISIDFLFTFLIENRRPL